MEIGVLVRDAREAEDNMGLFEVAALAEISAFVAGRLGHRRLARGKPREGIGGEGGE